MEKEKKDFIIYLIFCNILIFAIISRLAYLLTYLNNNPFSEALILDSHRYNQWALKILEGTSFESGAFYQAPFYPYFLASLYWIFDKSLPTVFIIQMAIGVANIFIVFLLAKRYFSDRVALLSSFIFSLYGPAIFFESKLLPETLAIFVNLLLLYFLSSYDRQSWNRFRISKIFLMLFGGLFLGLSCLIRPNMLLFAPFAVLWIILKKDSMGSHNPISRRLEIQRRLLYAFIFSVGVSLIIFPVTLRNYLESGEIVLISLNGGLTFYQGNNPYAEGVYTLLPGFSNDIAHHRIEERHYAEVEAQRDLSDVETSRFWLRKALKFMKDNPVQWIILEAKKLFYFFDNYEHSLAFSYPLERRYVTNISILPFAFLISFAVLGILGSFPWKERMPLIFYLFVQFLAVMLFFMSSRYRVPSVPVLCIFSGYGFFLLLKEMSRGNILRVVGATLLILIVAIFSFLKIGDVYQYEESSSHGSLGIAFDTIGMHQQALSSFEKQVELDPESPLALYNIGVVLVKMGKSEKAISYYEKAIELDPTLSEAYNNLGMIYINGGDYSLAEFFFQKAMNVKPYLEQPYINLISCYLMKGDMGKAIETKNLADLNGVRIPQGLEQEIHRIIEEK